MGKSLLASRAVRRASMQSAEPVLPHDPTLAGFPQLQGTGTSDSAAVVSTVSTSIVQALLLGRTRSPRYPEAETDRL